METPADVVAMNVTNGTVMADGDAGNTVSTIKQWKYDVAWPVIAIVFLLALLCFITALVIQTRSRQKGTNKEIETEMADVVREDIPSSKHIGSKRSSSSSKRLSATAKKLRISVGIDTNNTPRSMRLKKSSPPSPSRSETPVPRGSITQSATDPEGQCHDEQRLSTLQERGVQDTPGSCSYDSGHWDTTLFV